MPPRVYAATTSRRSVAVTLSVLSIQYHTQDRYSNTPPHIENRKDSKSCEDSPRKLFGCFSFRIRKFKKKNVLLSRGNFGCPLHRPCLHRYSSGCLRLTHIDRILSSESTNSLAHAIFKTLQIDRVSKDLKERNDGVIANGL
ncbi:hypothetical protein J6590_042244 [Homalodisca vitripennis]|nr:hypothetical protein J6590_042244 [Homalodisca vitripennis]